MNEVDFEGTLVLEKLAQIHKIDGFYDARLIQMIFPKLKL